MLVDILAAAALSLSSAPSASWSALDLPSEPPALQAVKPLDAPRHGSRGPSRICHARARRGIAGSRIERADAALSSQPAGFVYRSGRVARRPSTARASGLRSRRSGGRAPPSAHASS
jgi:hypothetical protein